MKRFSKTENFQNKVYFEKKGGKFEIGKSYSPNNLAVFFIK